MSYLSRSSKSRRDSIRDSSVPVREGVDRRGPEEGGGRGGGRPHPATERAVHLPGTAQEAHQYHAQLQHQHTVYIAAGVLGLRSFIKCRWSIV